MADYNDVIKQFKRMCRYYNNRATQNDCPLYCKGHGCNISHCRMLAFDDKKFQNVVMTWAEAHKEPVYLTWVEWLIEKGVIPEIGYMLATVHDPDTGEITEARISINPSALKPIPADLAAKLGVRPKEG